MLIRWARVRDLGAGAAAAVALAVIAGCASGSTDAGPPPSPSASAGPVPVASAPAPTPSPRPTSGTPTPAAVASPSPSRSTPASDIPANRMDFGFLAGSDIQDGATFVKLDRATLFTGAAANTEAAKRGLETPVPNDFLIVNDNPKLRLLRLSDGVQIYGTGMLVGSAEPVPIGLDELLDFVANDPGAKDTPFSLTYDAAGRVNSITEMYVP